MSAATTTFKGFDALDECHVQIQQQVIELASLARYIATDGVDAHAQRKAQAIEAFFSGTSRRHHQEEERNVFPPLLASGDDALCNAVRSLQQDHGWIEENWLELAPLLRAIAEGNNWYHDAEFQHAVEVFVELLEGHIALEESLIYPESKARWAEAVAARKPPPAKRKKA